MKSVNKYKLKSPSSRLLKVFLLIFKYNNIHIKLLRGYNIEGENKINSFCNNLHAFDFTVFSRMCY